MPISSTRAPESLARVPATVATRAPSRPASHGWGFLQPGRAAARAASTASTARRGDQRQEEEDDRAREAVGGELQPALRDVGEVAEPAGVEHRPGQVRVGPGEEVDYCNKSHKSERCGNDERGPRVAAGSRPWKRRPRPLSAGRSPRPRRPRSARRRRRGRRAGRRRGTPRRAARPVSRGAEALQRRAGTGDDEHPEQRLELVADPVEAHAEPRVRPEQRERGQRRAGDHVDRVGDRRRGRRRPRAPGSRASAARVSAARAGAPHMTSSCSTPWPAPAPRRPAAPAAGRRR